MGFNIKLILIYVFSLFQLSSHAQQMEMWQTPEELLYPAPKEMRLRVAQDEFKVMSFNVLNLFDTEHDEGKLDHTFLPQGYPGKAIECQKLRTKSYRKQCARMDWTPEKLVLKLGQIAKVVRIQGSLPDVLALQEIENENVVAMLGRVLGYTNYVVTNSPDKRGIDVALLFNQKKLEYLEHQEINVSQAVGFATRNILRVNFRPKVGRDRGKKIISMYVNHWPSQMAGSIARYTAAQALVGAIEDQINIYGAKNYYAIAMGDFNTVEKDSPHPFHELITSRIQWGNFMYDANDLSNSSYNPMRFKMPPATYWYSREGRYNLLDRIFISQNLYSHEGMTIMPRTYRIVGTNLNSVNKKYKNRSAEYYPVEQMVPLRYNFNTTDEARLGFSDHYPIVVKFKVK